MEKSGIRDWGLGIIIFIISVINIYSQDREPAQHLFTVNHKPNYLISSDSMEFKQDKFAFGFIWSGDYRLNAKLKFNWMQGYINYNDPYTSPPDKVKNSDYIAKINYLSWGTDTWFPFNAISYQYEPTLRIPDNNGFYIRPNDPSRAIFGFQHIDPNIQINDTDTRLLLYKTGTYSNPILKDPWISGRYFVVDPSNIEDAVVYTDVPSLNPMPIRQYSGREFYVNVNLRRLDTNDRLINDSVVLKIKLPYHKIETNTWDTIRFSYIPSSVLIDTSAIISALGDYRGCLRNTIISNSPKPKEMIITKKMIPLNKKDITISAMYELKGNLLNNNPVLSSNTFTGPHIDSIKIEVYYEKSCDVGLDFISINTPAARNLFFGAFDGSIVNRMQEALDTAASNYCESNGIKLKRVYLRDEQSPQGFGAARYFSKLVGNIGVSQDGSDYDRQLIYYTNEPQTWNEICSASIQSMAPYIRTAPWQTNKYGLNYKFGYSYNTDTLNSGWETYPYCDSIFNGVNYGGRYDLIRNCDDNVYKYILGSSETNQECIENHYYTCFLPNKPNSLNLYGPGIIWYECFSTVLTTLTDSTASPLRNLDKISYKRPPSGEEVRLWYNNALIFGAKGLFWDREYCDSSTAPGDLKMCGFGYGTKKYDAMGLNLSNFNIYNDNIGGDFLNLDSDYTHIQYLINTDSIRILLGISPQRIYLARKTYRTETMKISNLVRYLDTTENSLMNFNLQAAFLHGYKVFRHQHPKYSSSQFILDKFILLDSIKTRKLFQPNIDGTYSDNQPYEDTVHSFYNLTLLNSKYDTNMTNNFLIGIVNRRVDPLIHTIDSVIVGDTVHKDSSMKFYSSSELDDFVQHGGKRYTFNDTQDTTYWKYFWWRKTGSREITIPIKFRNNSVIDSSNTILTVKELGAGTSLDNLLWYRKPPYYHLIDTVIRNDSTVKIRLLPGDGKILNVGVHKLIGKDNDTNTVSVDTCDGCDAIARNFKITIESPPNNEGNGKHCFHVTFDNLGNCRYDNLAFGIANYGNPSDSVTVTPGNSFDNGNYWVCQDSMGSTGSKSINICYNETSTFKYQAVVGRIIDGKFFPCPPLTDTLLASSCCLPVQYTLNPIQDTCGCTTCGYELHVSTRDDDSTYTCFTDWDLIIANGNGIINPIHSQFLDKDNVTYRFCINDGTSQIKIRLMNNNVTVCLHDYNLVCHKCDSIHITEIVHSLSECGPTYIGCKFIYQILLGSLNNCIRYYDYGESLLGRDTVYNPNVPTNGITTILDSFNIPCGSHHYNFIFKDSLQNILCTKSLDLPCNCYNNPGVMCELASNPPFCCASVSVLDPDTNSTFPDIYHIRIINPLSPGVDLYDADRDPRSDPPFDFSPPGMYLTQICVPEDSAVNIQVLLYDADTTLRATLCYDSSCTSVKMKMTNIVDYIKAYPNPTKDVINVDYGLLDKATVTLDIYDDMGNDLKNIFKGTQGKGEYSFKESVEDLKTGLYYVVLKANDQYKLASFIVWR